MDEEKRRKHKMEIANNDCIYPVSHHHLHVVFSQKRYKRMHSGIFGGDGEFDSEVLKSEGPEKDSAIDQMRDHIRNSKNRHSL
jgi:hypothetical protein